MKIAIRIAVLMTFFGSGLVAHAELIAAYNFEADEGCETPQFTDRSGNGNHLTIFTDAATPTWNATSGVEGGAFTFDKSDLLIAPIDVRAQTLPKMTWGAWVQIHDIRERNQKVLGASGGAFQRAIGIDNRPDGNQFRYTAFAGQPNGQPRTGQWIGTNSWYTCPRDPGKWAFIAAAYDNEAGKLTFYCDLDVNSTTEPLHVEEWNTNLTDSGQTKFAIGALRPDVVEDGFGGIIDNVFVHDEVLDGKQLTAYRNGGFQAIMLINNVRTTRLSRLEE